MNKLVFFLVMYGLFTVTIVILTTEIQKYLLERKKMKTRTSIFVAEFPADAPNQWTLEKGDFQTGFRLANPKMGVALEYGSVRKAADGQVIYCQPRIFQPGGAVIVPFLKVLNEKGDVDRVKIGIELSSERPVADGFYMELVRGFSDPAGTKFETPRATASREFGETDEASVKYPEERFTLLGGPFNMDTTWFNHPSGRGVFVYACEVFEHEVAFVKGRVTFKPNITTHAKLSKVEFIDLELIRTECGMTQLGISMLRNNLGL